jgi:hypothetical protein
MGVELKLNILLFMPFPPKTGTACRRGEWPVALDEGTLKKQIPEMLEQNIYAHSLALQLV